MEHTLPRYQMSDLGVFTLHSFINILLLIDTHAIEHEREEELGEMFSPNKSGEYTPCGDVASFTIQGLREALTAAESTVTETSCPVDEFIIQLEVMMVD